MLNQSTHVQVTNSTASMVRNGPFRRITSVLYTPITDSARALSPYVSRVLHCHLSGSGGEGLTGAVVCDQGVVDLAGDVALQTADCVASAECGPRSLVTRRRCRSWGALPVAGVPAGRLLGTATPSWLATRGAVASAPCPVLAVADPKEKLSG